MLIPQLVPIMYAFPCHYKGKCATNNDYYTENDTYFLRSLGIELSVLDAKQVF